MVMQADCIMCISQACRGGIQELGLVSVARACCSSTGSIAAGNSLYTCSCHLNKISPTEAKGVDMVQRDSLSAHLKPGLPSELASIVIDAALISVEVDGCQLVALPRCKVIGVMGRGDFDSTSPELHVHELCVQYDGDLSLIQWMLQRSAMELLVPARAAAASRDHETSQQPHISTLLQSHPRCNLRSEFSG